VKRLFILKLGSTWPATAQSLGDFDDWTLRSLGPIDVPTEVIDVEHGAQLPGHEHCAGAILTGSHAMVTDRLPWSVNLEGWLRDAVDRQVPILGVCYGHQLLAQATGGRVDYHPAGREIGTVEIRTLLAGTDDALFAGTPESFPAHTTHAQSVLELPPGALHLAGNDYEPNHAFRLGECAWGVQFHPEYDTAIMHEYINALHDQLLSAGLPIEKLAGEVTNTPVATSLLRRFGKLVGERA
jgi:GMP synthase (glutamine-hydrolysing)